MDSSDFQKLHQYILDYMIMREMHAAADTFAKEADVCHDPALMQSGERILSEWWSGYSKVYRERTPEGSSSAVSADGFSPIHESQNAGNDQHSGNGLTESPPLDKFPVLQNDSPGEPQSALPTAGSMPSSGVVDSQERALPIPNPTAGLGQDATQSTAGDQSQDDFEPFAYWHVLFLQSARPDQPPQSALPKNASIPSSDMVNSPERALPTTIPSPNHPVAVEGSSSPDNSQDSQERARPTAVPRPTPGDI